MLAPGFMNSVYCTETEMSGHAKLHANCYLYIYILSLYISFFLLNVLLMETAPENVWLQMGNT